MTLLITYIVFALLISFLCSLLEATLLTLTPTSIGTAKEAGRSWAARMEKLKLDVERPLSAILTLNTIAHTMGAAGAGAEYARLYGNVGEGLFAAGLTLAILVLTEIIPKTLGARHALELAGFTAWILPKMIALLSPLIALLRLITQLITPKGSGAKPMHREELLTMARMGQASGSLRERESQMVQNIIQLHHVRAWDIMTPRPVIFALSEKTTLAEFVPLIEDKPYTRVPVYGENRDDMKGFVIRGDALLALLKAPDQQLTLTEVLRPLAVTQEDMPVDRLFQRFIAERLHIIMVTDEFGGMQGLITLEDILETIFGVEIMDEKDKVEDLQALARKLWRERADRMGIELPPESPADPVAPASANGEDPAKSAG
jgi:CBS domain containing-hemolysin-like protein